jgi:tetratricopeptide (TPR) repeat protein
MVRVGVPDPEGYLMRKARWIAGVLLLAPSLVLAQAQGRIKGLFSDAKGKPIMSCPEIANFHREVMADDKGNYATLVVDATKDYKFRVEAQGYQPVELMKKPLIGGQTLELNFTLQSIVDLQAKEQQKALEEPGIKQLREGQELAEEGKVAEARAKYAEAVAVKPDLYLAWLAQGDIDQKAGKNDDALNAADKCLATKPNFPQCLALGMNAAQAKKDNALYQKYAAAYKNANPTDPVVYFNEAVPLINKGDFSAAKPLLEKALAADPNYADALYQLGTVYASLGDNAKAKETLEKALLVAPKHQDAATARAMLDWVKTQIK